MDRKVGIRIGFTGRLVCLAAAASLMAACNTTQDPDMPSPGQAQAIDEAVQAADAGNQIRVTWDCDGEMIPVTFMDDAALVDLPDGTSVTLPIARSGSGARYTNGSVTYWEHQGTAMIETPTQSWEGCTRSA